jgi:hypothetical protein
MSIALNNHADLTGTRKENPMGKSNHDNTLHGQRTSRSLLAISLAASLAAFGCTTNLNPGNGTPTRSPEVRTAPTAGVTSGGETTTPPVDPATNPPMTSSYSRPEPLPAVTQRSIRRSAAEAAAIMADNQPSGGRYLGIVSPGTPGRGYQSDRIATFVPPALQTNPQLTLNASISSDPTSAINSVTAADAGVTTGGVTAGGATTVGVTVTGTAAPTPTTAATTVTPGMVAGTTPLPTLASANTPSVTAASVGLGRVTAAGTRTSTTAATTGTTTAATTAIATTTAGATAARGGLSPVRIQRGTNGGVTVTNVGTSTRTTTTTTTTGRSQ